MDETKSPIYKRWYRIGKNFANTNKKNIGLTGIGFLAGLVVYAAINKSNNNHSGSVIINGTNYEMPEGASITFKF